MLPTKEEYQKSNARWRVEHRGVSVEISHHGVSEYTPSGTWCYYLIIDQRMFQSADDWAKFDVKPVTRKWCGTFREHLPYDDLPDLEWHCGPTFGERHEGVDTHSGEKHAWLKIGCDYAHLWDRDMGYPATLASVTADARRSVDTFVDRFPQKERCGYSGRIGMPDEFYTAQNGVRVHASYEEKIRETGWKTWLPAAAELEAAAVPAPAAE